MKRDFKGIGHAEEPDEWLDLPPLEFIRGSVHEILNQMTGIKALLDLVHSEETIATAGGENALSPILENTDMVEIIEAARGNCRSIVTALNIMYGYAQAKSDAEQAPPPAPAAPTPTTT